MSTIVAAGSIRALDRDSHVRANTRGRPARLRRVLDEIRRAGWVDVTVYVLDGRTHVHHGDRRYVAEAPPTPAPPAPARS